MAATISAFEMHTSKGSPHRSPGHSKGGAGGAALREKTASAPLQPAWRPC